MSVRSLHRFTHSEGMTEGDPARAVTPPRPPRRLPKALSVAQVQTLLAAPGEDTELALRDTALLELLYSTGVRISEAVQLDVDDVWHALRSPDDQVPTSRPRQRQQGAHRADRVLRSRSARPLSGAARPVLVARGPAPQPCCSMRGAAD